MVNIPEFKTTYLSSESYILDGATNAEVLDILELSFEYLISLKEELVSKFGGKGFGLLLAKALEKRDCFGDRFYVSQFHLIPTNFYSIQNLNDFSDFGQISFDSIQEKYLTEVFERFSDGEYISVRSSADIEDNGNRNYSGVFYSGFCKTDDFEAFKREIKKVLFSAKNTKPYANMGIVVMKVAGKYDEEGGFSPDGGGVMATTNFGDRTTISAEFGLPIGITSSENEDAITTDFDKSGNLLQVCVKDGDSLKVSIKSRFVLKGGKVIKVENTNELEYFKDGRGVFSEDVYRNLVYIGKIMQEYFGYPLDIEFSIVDGKIILLQIRKFIDKYKKPSNMVPPDLYDKEIVLSPNQIISGLGFFRSYRIKCHRVSNVHNRNLQSDLINNAIKKAEAEKLTGGYILDLGSISSFPDLHFDFSGLKLVLIKTKGNYKLSHAYMMLRELGIPVLFYNGRLDCSDGDFLGVYLDGNNTGVIFRDKQFGKYF
ncbi:MAG: PEP/pyruvate-binding domain-containing protein [Candidatus Gracilibacteria bacterium]|nr:PEP/pyruvate-binding domain-containing protein [Candidatus Gracilibacteria bacterium]